MKKRVLLLPTMFLCIILACAVAYAADADVTVETVKDRISDMEKGYAEYKIAVENTGDSTETFTLYNLDPPDWFAQLLPGPSAREVTLAPGESGEFHTYIKSSNLAKYKGKAIIVTAFIRPSSEPLDQLKAPMRVVIEAGPQQLPAPPEADFSVDVSVPSQMDPHGTYNVLVNIKNNNARLLEDVEVKLQSNILSEETTVHVNPDDSKTVSFAVLLLDNIKPQKDQLHISVKYQDELFYEGDHNFEVVEFLPPFTTDIQVEKKWLKQVRTITVTNTGNTKKEDSLRLQTSLKEKFFSKAEPAYEFLKEGGKYYFVWQMSLEADESTDIILTTSYRWLLLVALVIIAILAYKIAMSNPLIVKKKIKSMHKAQGAISEMTVVLYMKNRGKDTISNLRVVERVSGMVKLKSDSFAGSMHPVKMHPHDREGTLLEYRFAELTPGDTRIITYKVHSKLHIFGTITIKPTVVEFTNKKGQKKKSQSNSLAVETEETKAPEHKSSGHKGHEHHKHK